MIKIETEDAPKAKGPYSQAIKAGDFLFVSGQLPINPKTDKVDESTIEGQTRQVLTNISSILKAAGLNFNHVVRVEVFLKDIQDWPAMNVIYAEVFSGPIKPARHAFQVGKLPLDVRVEISCIAYIQ
jgi:2-iminobutanoate/2-iminopropanoate deaminase